MEATAGQDGCLKSMKPLKDDWRKIVANKLRKNSRHFVNNEIRSVPWQLDYVGAVG